MYIITNFTFSLFYSSGNDSTSAWNINTLIN